MSTHRQRFMEVGAVGAVLLGVVLLRGWLFATGRVTLDGEECYLALQGLDILHGSLHVFYYGQNYMGCLEAYGFALVRLLCPFSTPLTVQVQGLAQTLLFLVTAWLLVRRFFGRSVAWATLLLLAFPPQLLAIWLGKIRGYMPWLILGHGILYLVLQLAEAPDAARSRGRFVLLGVLLGLAWWANPLSINYCVTLAVLALAWKGLRRGLWQGAFHPAPALFVNAAAVAALALLESRALFDERRSALLLALFLHRRAVLGALALVGLGAAALALARRRGNFNLALLCLGFLAGDAPALAVYWTVGALNLKQGLDGWDNIWRKMVLAPMLEFPLLAGLIAPGDRLEKPLFSLAVNLFVILVYLCALYGALRLLRRYGRPLAAMIVFAGVTLLLFWVANTVVVGQERYLLCLYLPMFVFLGVLVRELNLLARGLGAVVLLLMFSVHLAGLWQMPPYPVRLPGGVSAQEQAILDYSRARGLGEVLIEMPDDVAQRLTFFAEGRMVYFNPNGYFNRIERHKQRFRGRADYPLLCPAKKHLESKIGHPPDDRLGEFDVFLRVPQGLIFRLYDSAFLQ